MKVYSIIGFNDDRPIDLAKILNSQIKLTLFQAQKPTITKHRYIDSGTNSKVFETYDFDPNELSEDDISHFLKNLESISESDLVLVADYGHGLLTKSVIKKVIDDSNFLAVNTQANAGNRGFNTLTKYEQLDFFTANSGELSLELRSKYINFEQELPSLMKRIGASRAVLTLGADGLEIFESNKVTKAPALAIKIVDKVGAGDSVFAISKIGRAHV